MGLRRFYAMQTAVLEANAPLRAHHLACVCPGNPNWTLVLVHDWDSHDEQDRWEAFAGVIEIQIADLTGLAPPAVITAIGPWGATTGMTWRQVFGCVRANWPVWRH